MTSFLERLYREEAGTCMTDSRGMYGWVAAIAVTVYFVYGHRFPAFLAYLDHLLPGATAYNFHP